MIYEGITFRLCACGESLCMQLYCIVISTVCVNVVLNQCRRSTGPVTVWLKNALSD